MRLLTTGNPKTAKGRQYGYHTGILHLYPDAKNCQWWSEGCRTSCLNTAGRAGIIKAGEKTNVILEARKRRTRLLRTETWAFLRALQKDVNLLQAQALDANLIAACRLNGTSDLDWIKFIGDNPGVQFYDYTKSYHRMLDFLTDKLPENYHLTFSRTEENVAQCIGVLHRKGNIAVVTMTGGWDGESLLDGYGGTVNGDMHDLTFLHPPKSILVLKAKGKARKDTTGFVIQC